MKKGVKASIGIIAAAIAVFLLVFFLWDSPAKFVPSTYGYMADSARESRLFTMRIFSEKPLLRKMVNGVHTVLYRRPRRIRLKTSIFHLTSSMRLSQQELFSKIKLISNEKRRGILSLRFVL